MSLRLAALLAWLFTVGFGGYMLQTWIARGGLQRQRATGVGVPPALVFGHASAAVAGLAIWLGFLASGWHLLAWLAVTLVCAAICLGVCTVTLWTPYPVQPVPDWTAPPRATGPLEAVTVTDEMIAALLTGPPPRRRRTGRLLPLVPAVHGLAAVATFLLTVTAALLPVR